MQIFNFPKCLICPATLVVVGLGGAVFAQDAEEQPAPAKEELQTIELDRGGVPADEPPEEEFEDLVFDEASQSYRLIEDDSGDDWVDPPSDRETQTEELKRLFELYREAIGNRDFLEADTLAKRVVELSIELNGLDSHDSAKAITNLGIAQHGNGDYESAMRNFMASIDIIERIDDNLSPALINPLQGLAATQAAIGRPDLAKLSYQRAVHVSHVNEGPHNKDQVEILESMAELDISQGEYEDATDIQEHIYAIQSRNLDPDSLDMIPALEKRAGWQHRLQQYHRERVTWRQIIDIIEDHEGKESLTLIGPLTNLGKSYLFVSPAEFDYQPEVSTSSGESYLRRADTIAEEHPDATWETRENTLLSLGDYYILSGRPGRAVQTYQDAWEMLTEGDVPEMVGARREHLEKVKMLQRVFPPRYYNSQREEVGQLPPDSFETGTMSFSFTVSSNGRVTNLRHIETQPRELSEFSEVVGRSLRRLIYRPRMVNAEITPTPDVIYTHEFYYRPSDVPEPAPDDSETDSVTEDPADEPPAGESEEGDKQT
jgi:tetratricopeptide (TPR) repeat protein